MLSQATKVVLIQYGSQALLAFIVMLLLRRFYRNYQNKYFQYWSWSWLGLMLSLLGSGLALYLAFSLDFSHPVRTSASLIALIAGLFQAVWLLIGSYELSQQREFSKRLVIIISLLLIVLAISLVFPYSTNPESFSERLFLRVGIRSLLSSISFILSAIIITKLFKSGIGVKFIIAAFLVYGLIQFNYFLTFLMPLLDVSYPLRAPYYLGIVDFFLQAMMGIGMIISVLEIEQERLKKANNELDTFLYRSSHDLRAPLTTILGLVYAIKTERDKSEIDGFVDLIENRVHQADKVINDIINLRKGQKIGISVTNVNLRDRVQSTFEMLTSPETSKIELKLKSEKDYIHTDREKIDTILVNIISNAMKYHDMRKPDPMIGVEIKKSEQGVQMDIYDNGVGIDEKYLPKIFDMFYRANKQSKGSGLGLYMTKDALDHIGGSIAVESQQGVGTRFKLFIKDLEP